MEVINIKNIIFGEGNPKICVPLVEKTQDKIINQVKKIKQTSADCLEWRCDFFEECENPFAVQQVLMQLRQIWEKPLIFTFRTLEEGGQKEINQKI